MDVGLGETAALAAAQRLGGLAVSEELAPAVRLGADEPADAELLLPGEGIVPGVAAPPAPAPGNRLGLEHRLPPGVPADAAAELPQFAGSGGLLALVLLQGLDGEGLDSRRLDAGLVSLWELPPGLLGDVLGRDVGRGEVPGGLFVLLDCTGLWGGGIMIEAKTWQF